MDIWKEKSKTSSWLRNFTDYYLENPVDEFILLKANRPLISTGRWK